MTRILATVVAVALASSAALAEETQERQPSRFTYRSIDSGTADDLVKPREPVGKIRVIKAEPLVGNARRTTSTDSTSTSNLTGSTGLAKNASQAATRAMTAPVQFQSAIRATAAAATAQTETGETQSAVPPRTAVDRNAALVKAYHEAYPNAVAYQPATVVEPDPVQYATAAGYTPRVIYGNTYGTHSPAYYEGRVVYGSYANYHTGYYRPRTYVTTSYCAPSYTYCAPTYYPSYSSYCAPRYSSNVYYRSSYCSTPRFYIRPSFSFHYGFGRGYCGGGSRWGFSIGF